MSAITAGPDTRTVDERDEAWDQTMRELGYTWCRPCAEWHKTHGECPIDQDGQPLAPCGCRWTDIEDSGDHRSACVYAEG